MRDVSHRSEYLLALILFRIVRGLSPTGARRLGDVLGGLLFHLVRVRRDVTLRQLAHAFPEMTRREIPRCGRGCYNNLCRIVIEAVRLPDMSLVEMESFFRVKGQHYLDEGLAQGRGLVVVTFHLGNWELVGAYAARLGYPLSVVAQRIGNPYIDLMVTRLRSAAGMRVIPRRRAVRGSVEALRENRLVVFLADQDARDNGVFVPFFGRPASTPKGPAVLSFHRDAPAVMAFMVRGDDGRYDVVIEPIRYDRQGDRETDVRGFTETFTSRLEEYVRAHPEQWLWQHRRWKTAVSGGI